MAPAGGAPTVVTTYDGLGAVEGAVRGLLARGDVVVELVGPGAADVRLLAALARLALAARRAGHRLRVRAERDDVRALAGLCGLSGALGLPPASAEAGGQPEPGEQPGAEEVVDVRDPSA